MSWNRGASGEYLGWYSFKEVCAVRENDVIPPQWLMKVPGIDYVGSPYLIVYSYNLPRCFLLPICAIVEMKTNLA